MIEIEGNIWDYFSIDNWVVITTNGAVLEFLEQEHLVAFPTKHNWYDATPDIKLIEEGLKELSSHTGIFYMPRLGCGNGHLNWEEQVQPLMKQYLVSDRFRIVTPRRIA